MVMSFLVNSKTDGREIACFGKSWRLSKAVDGSPHTTTFAALQERMAPVCHRIGLQRLADISCLDRIGIPVVNAVRPATVGMSVAHGKGRTLEGAKASALMESCERYWGCNVELPLTVCSYRELQRRYDVIPEDRLPWSRDALFSSGLPEPWVAGWDLIGNREVMVPWRLVTMLPPRTGFDSFARSSNGLAAGLEFLEALSQALFEVIERDALSCHHALMHRQRQMFPVYRLPLQEIVVPDLRRLIEQIQAAEIEVLLFDCTVDTRVPTYECSLFDERDPEMPLCSGMGASLDMETALSRALTEAVQGRAVYLSGCRETFLAAEMGMPLEKNRERCIEYLRREDSFPDRGERSGGCCSTKTGSFEEDINLCLARLRGVGVEQVIVVRLTEEDEPFNVVRVIVPGLEGCDELINYTPGKRAADYRGDCC